VGETYDVDFSTPTSHDLVLDLLLPAQKIHTAQTLAFVHPSSLLNFMSRDDLAGWAARLCDRVGNP
jgi:hypothetical protein